MKLGKIKLPKKKKKTEDVPAESIEAAEKVPADEKVSAEIVDEPKVEEKESEEEQPKEEQPEEEKKSEDDTQGNTEGAEDTSLDEKKKKKKGLPLPNIKNLSKKNKIIILVAIIVVVIAAVLVTVFTVKSTKAKKEAEAATNATTVKTVNASEKASTTGTVTTAFTVETKAETTKKEKETGPTTLPVTKEYTTTASVPIDADFLGDYKGYDINGKAVDAKIFSGKKLTMINIWGTNCYYCLHEMPDLAKVSKDYASKNVQIIGAVTDYNNTEIISDIIKESGSNYLQIQCNTFIRDAAAITNNNSAIPGTPYTFFVDAKGHQVGAGYSGARSETQWKAIIDETLKSVK